MERNLRITDWPKDERPRERLTERGAEALTNAELIAILVGQGTSKYNAVELARKLLHSFKSLQALSEASLAEMQLIDGIGPAKAVTLLASFQLYRNMKKEKAENEVVHFKDPKEIWKIYKSVLGSRAQESFWVILLNNALRKITDFEVSRGILDQTVVHPREVFREAIRHNAKGVILMHNHPSGVLVASEEDIKLTARLKESGKILGITVYDHIIISENGYYSFVRSGLI